jgi:ketosteroid isomerase-like protein
MSESEEGVGSARRHAFAAAIKARDHAALVEALAEDVVLHSAVTAAPFMGKETVGELYASVIDSFEHVEIVDDFSSGDTYAFFWRGRIDGRFVEGADRLRVDADGKALEITVLARPLSGLSTFLTAIGARFARQRRGERVGTLLRAGARPLPPTFALLDPVTRWLVRGKRGR